MVISAINVAQKSNQTFGNSTKVNPKSNQSVILKTGEEIAHAKPNSGAVRRFFTKAFMTLGVLGAAYGCEKDPIEPPTPTVTNELSANDKNFMKVAKIMTALDKNETGMLDSALVDEAGQKISWKVDVKNSNNDTVYVKSKIYKSDGKTVDWNILYKYFNDGSRSDDVITRTAQTTRDGSYNFTKGNLRSPGGNMRYVMEGETLVQYTDALKVATYDAIETGKSAFDNLIDGLPAGFVNNLFKSMRK